MGWYDNDDDDDNDNDGGCWGLFGAVDAWLLLCCAPVVCM